MANIQVSNSVLLVFYLLLSDCGGGASPAPTAGPSNPPKPVSAPQTCDASNTFASPIVATVTSPSVITDASSIQIPVGAVATDLAGNRWCGVPVVTELKLSNLPPCVPFACLSALDITPDRLDWGSVDPKKPILTYNLNAHPPSCKPESGNCQYAVYQYYYTNTPPVPYLCTGWCFAGDAKLVSVGTVQNAIASLDHFSTYALVVLPSPSTVPTPSAMTTTVTSRFVRGSDNAVWVASSITAADARSLSKYVSNFGRLFRFVLKEPPNEGKWPACSIGGLKNLNQPPSLADRLSCAFPIGTEVVVQTRSTGSTGQIAITDTIKSTDPKFRGTTFDVQSSWIY